MPLEPPAREFFIDWLRIIALCLLILYHVGMAYVSWGWHVKSAAAADVAAWVEPWMRLTSPWRMTLLFVVSGWATALLLQRRASTSRGWLRQRARRLLLPLLAGVVLIVPPQAYFEVRQFHAYGGHYVDFLQLYFSGYGGFCAPQRGCLLLPTWNHLWFLPYLFLYTAVLAWVHGRWPSALGRAATRLPKLLAGAGLLVWPTAWLALTRLTLRPLFGETHALLDDLFVHAQFAPAFALGVLLAWAPKESSQRVAPVTTTATFATIGSHIEATRHLALVLSLLGWGLLVATAPGPAWRALPWSVMQWCAVVAALGYARRHLQRDSAARRALSAAVFPVYLVHQTVIVAGVALLARWQLAPAVEAAMLVVATCAIGWAFYALARRFAALGPWFGVAEGRLASRENQDAEMRVIAPRVSTYSAPSLPTSMSTGSPLKLPKA